MRKNMEKKNKKIKLGLLGPEGTFGEEAALIYSKTCESGCEFLFFGTHLEVMEALKNDIIDEGFVAAENMINGTVREVLDELYENEFIISHEIVLPIHLSLAALPGQHEIKDILSHSVALFQVRKYLKKKYPDARVIPVGSTAAAMKKISEKKMLGTAGVGPEIAAERYGLEIIDKNIEDFKGNETRFLVISINEPQYVSGCRYKTSIGVYHEEDFPGLLHSILEPFAKEGINLTKIESRPTKKKLGTYVFFIDIEGHVREEKPAKAIKSLKKKMTEVKILGSYKT